MAPTNLKKTNLRPFQCNLCDNATAKSSSLKDHKRTHTGEGPFPCEIWNFSGVSKSSLGVHIHTHTPRKDHLNVNCVTI